ncbi:MAG TPA: hypothetical protein VK448_05250 [Dissulfurispiraceae bacterium]|nr:hypothetical protein [Dissulfurispiraceae bacterium]
MIRAFWSLPYRIGAVMILFLTFFYGCALKSTVPPQNINAEEQRLTGLIVNSSNPIDLSDLYLQRARLRVMSVNPKPDYYGALKDFSASLNMDSTRSDAQDIRDWITALRRLITAEQDVARYKARNDLLDQRNLSLERRNLVLDRQNLSLKATIDQLEKQEKELRRSIEEMQAMEIKMEKRRQKLR